SPGFRGLTSARPPTLPFRRKRMTARNTRWSALRVRVLVSSLFALATLAAALPARADDINTQWGPSKKPAKPAAAAPTRKDMKEWGRVTKDSQELPGLFRVYKKKDAWYMSIRKDQLDKPYMLALDLGRGIGSNGLYGGTTLNEDVVRFRRKAD